MSLSVYKVSEDSKESPSQLMKKYLKRSDVAMYKAKELGRNQTKCWHELSLINKAAIG